MDVYRTIWLKQLGGSLFRKSDRWAKVPHNKYVFTVNFLDTLNVSSKKQAREKEGGLICFTYAKRQILENASVE